MVASISAPLQHLPPTLFSESRHVVSDSVHVPVVGIKRLGSHSWGMFADSTSAKHKTVIGAFPLIEIVCGQHFDRQNLWMLPCGPLRQRVVGRCAHLKSDSRVEVFGCLYEEKFLFVSLISFLLRLSMSFFLAEAAAPPDRWFPASHVGCRRGPVCHDIVRDLCSRSLLSRVCARGRLGPCTSAI